jgi:hypothetical protein
MVKLELVKFDKCLYTFVWKIIKKSYLAQLWKWYWNERIYSIKKHTNNWNSLKLRLNNKLYRLPRIEKGN